MEKQHIYDIIVNNLPIGFSIVDKDGIIVDFNQAAETITGYLKEHVIGKSHLEIFHGTSDKTVCPLFKHALEHHEQTVAMETTVTKKNGEVVIVSVTASPLFDSKGNFVGGVELFRDITEIKRLERERKNILSMFAHDMKNPILTAGGFLSRLLTHRVGTLTEKQTEYLEIVSEEISSLEKLVTDFLDFSRFEAKEYKPILAPFSIELAIRKQIETAKIEANKKLLKIILECPDDIPPVISADTGMIHRVIMNLLDNAIRYTNPEGTVTVKITNRDKDILVQVIDTGIGIPENHLPYIFDAFYRADRHSKGSGLGLSIAKTIIEAHGGSIWAESTPGKGSIFSFSLPKG